MDFTQTGTDERGGFELPNRHDPATAMVTAGSDLTEPAALAELLLRCRAALRAANQRLILDLTNVEVADTKLVAALVILRRTARRAAIAVVVRPSNCVKVWLTVCRLECLMSED